MEWNEKSECSFFFTDSLVKYKEISTQTIVWTINGNENYRG